MLIAAVWLTLILRAASAAQICCPDIGCFTNDPPFNSQNLPWCLSSMSPPLKYTMYTRSNSATGEVLTHTTVPSVYSGARRTILIAHGWNSDGTVEWIHTMKNSFLNREDMNVIILDWSGGADMVLNYGQAAANTRSVGAYTALVFANLVANGGSDTRMWCTGHSLGAHLCGHAGMKTTLQRITGMDPAGPDFEGVLDRTVGLNQLSARFVDVIHTDTTYGTLRDLGHIDFFPAGGHDQPACRGVRDEDVPKGDIGCSHGYSHTYMEESIRSDCYLSRWKCTDYNNMPGSCSGCTCGSSACAVMGYGSDTGCQRDGWFYLSVNAAAPYCNY